MMYVIKNGVNATIQAKYQPYLELPGGSSPELVGRNGYFGKNGMASLEWLVWQKQALNCAY